MEKINFTKLDGGTIEERLNEAKKLFGLSPEQTFQDLDDEKEE